MTRGDGSERRTHSRRLESLEHRQPPFLFAGAIFNQNGSSSLSVLAYMLIICKDTPGTVLVAFKGSGSVADEWWHHVLWWGRLQNMDGLKEEEATQKSRNTRKTVKKTEPSGEEISISHVDSWQSQEHSGETEAVGDVYREASFRNQLVFNKLIGLQDRPVGWKPGQELILQFASRIYSPQGNSGFFSLKVLNWWNAVHLHHWGQSLQTVNWWHMLTTLTKCFPGST